MKRADWDSIKLRITSHHGKEPLETGDELRTRTGRRYQILSINGKVHTCLVLPADAEVQGTVYELRWNTRTKRAR